MHLRYLLVLPMCLGALGFGSVLTAASTQAQPNPNPSASVANDGQNSNSAARANAAPANNAPANAAPANNASATRENPGNRSQLVAINTRQSDAFQQELLRLTNAERTKRGLAALRLSPTLSSAAQRHAQDMIQRRYFDHTSPDGSQPRDRARAAGYQQANYVGENIAAGQDNAEAVVAGWMDSQGHRRNILNKNFKEIGFGYDYSASDEYGHYWVQVFGSGQR
jgi:uncharacterized protein YkwD